MSEYDDIHQQLLQMMREVKASEKLDPYYTSKPKSETRQELENAWQQQEQDNERAAAEASAARGDYLQYDGNQLAWHKNNQPVKYWGNHGASSNEESFSAPAVPSTQSMGSSLGYGMWIGDEFVYDTDIGKALVKAKIEAKLAQEKQPTLLSGGLVDYRQPTRQTKIDPNQITSPVVEKHTYSVRGIPEDETVFDGEYENWMNDGRVYKRWKGMSGATDFQKAFYQNVAGKGPLPEGTYWVKQNNLQHWDDLPWYNKLASSVSGGRISDKKFGAWPGGTKSWGKHRIWLEPDANTNTYGRNGLAIHGGDEFGSEGCIDLEKGIDDFAQNFKEYGYPMKQIVAYKK